ncbi:MAG: hypothetical protein JO250_19380 [Armatimonadetes bacterium]|nr:hypothetical protein [Armatimonadota bacterium]
MPTNRTLAVAALAATLAGASAARADLTVVQSTTIKNPQITAMMQSMSPQQRAMMARSGAGAFMGGGPLTSTLYSQGSKTRVDVGPQSTIVDAAAHKLIMLNRATHTYRSSPYSPNAMAGQMQASVRDTGQTKTILHHPARHYVLTMTSARMQGARISGDIWSAQDLPQPPAAALAAGGPAAALQGQFRKIKGLPLLVNMTISGTPVGDTSIHSVTKSVSRAPLSASLFTVPAGYKRAAARPMPGAMPMGR